MRGHEFPQNFRGCSMRFSPLSHATELCIGPVIICNSIHRSLPKGEGFAGALWWKELVDLCKEVGLSGPYFVSGYSMEVKKEEHKKLLGMCQWTMIYTQCKLNSGLPEFHPCISVLIRPSRGQCLLGVYPVFPIAHTVYSINF